MDVAPLDLGPLLQLEPDAEVKVAPLAVPHPAGPPAGHPDLGTLGDPLGDGGLQGSPAVLAAGPRAGRADLHPELGGGAAPRARLSHVPGATAGGAGFDDGDVHGPLPAGHCLLEGDLQLILGVGPLLRRRVLAPELVHLSLDPGIVAVRTAAAEERLEEIAEAAEAVARPLGGALSGLPGPRSGIAEGLAVLAPDRLGPLDLLPVSSQAIVFGALLRVLEDLVGLVYPLEPLGGPGVLVDVRVQLAGQFAIARPDLLVG